MKNLGLLVIIGMLAGSLAPAQGRLEGGVSGGGGKVVVKRDKDGKLASVQLLDLWEAENIFDRKINYSDAPVAEQVAAGLQNIKYALRHANPNISQWTLDQSAEATARLLSDLEYIAKMFLDPNHFLVKRFRDVTLTPSQDAFEQVKPRDGALEQMINRIEQGPHWFHLDEDLWDAMNNTNKAAAIIHEAFYYQLWKSYDESNSIRVRRTVGLAMSGYQFQPFEKFIPRKYVECDSIMEEPYPPISRIYFIERGSGIKAVADIIAGIPALGFTDPIQGLDNTSLEKFFSPQPGRPIGVGIFSTGLVDFELDAWFLTNINEKGEPDHSLILKGSPMPLPKTNLLTKMKCTLHN